MPNKCCLRLVLFVIYSLRLNQIIFWFKLVHAYIANVVVGKYHTIIFFSLRANKFRDRK